MVPDPRVDRCKLEMLPIDTLAYSVLETVWIASGRPARGTAMKRRDEYDSGRKPTGRGFRARIGHEYWRGTAFDDGKWLNQRHRILGMLVDHLMYPLAVCECPDRIRQSAHGSGEGCCARP